MKLSRALPLLFFFLLPGCKDSCKVTRTYIHYLPVYSTTAEVKEAVAYMAPRDMKSPGKIYFKDGFLYINEVGEGIHVIDNHDPSSPQVVGFLNLPGTFDLAIIDHYLYADSFVDLVVFDVSDPSSIHEVARQEGVFSHGTSYGFANVTNSLVLTSWKKVSAVTLDESPCVDGERQYLMYDGGIALFSGTANASTSSAVVSVPTTSPGPGIGGSMARFTISHGTLYALDAQYMQVLSLANTANPVRVTEMNIDWGIETLFPYKDNLYAGSRSGMYIYGLENPRTPRFISKYDHIRSCDPVVVDDKYAYITLRDGNTCQGYSNQLDIVDISVASSPVFVKSYPMKNPHGLGIDNKMLFICDGADGLKVYDASDVTKIDVSSLAHYPGLKALDIIPINKTAMMISSDGLYQYSYADPNNIFLLSKLPIVK